MTNGRGWMLHATSLEPTWLVGLYLCLFGNRPLGHGGSPLGKEEAC